MNRPTKITLFGFCIVKLVLHLIADSNSGFQGDELLHIETGNNLAFGFMEFPPIIGLLAFIQNLLQSTSVFAHHIFAHIAAILTLIYVSKITIELGGETKAIFLVLLCIIIAPAFGRSQQLFQPVVFSQFFWVLNFFFLTKFVKSLDRTYLWLLTFGAALAFLTKYNAVFFIFGVSSLLLFKSTRQALIKQNFWWNIIVFIILISPNIIWQIANDFPVLKMFDRLYETQLDRQAPPEVLQGLLVALNPLTLLITIPAIVSMFHHSMKSYRPLTVSILLSIIFLAFSQGKGYYFYPIALTILPFGGVFWEQNILPKRKWLIYPIGILLAIGVFLIPFGVPVFPLESYLKHDYPYENRDVVKGGQFNVRFEERYSKEKWAVTLKELKTVYD
ncbi:MAG: glycosyltransferase family 39 protein, partial [Muriicola sp.]